MAGRHLRADCRPLKNRIDTRSCACCAVRTQQAPPSFPLWRGVAPCFWWLAIGVWSMDRALGPRGGRPGLRGCREWVVSPAYDGQDCAPSLCGGPRGGDVASPRAGGGNRAGLSAVVVAHAVAEGGDACDGVHGLDFVACRPRRENIHRPLESAYARQGKEALGCRLCVGQGGVADLELT